MWPWEHVAFAYLLYSLYRRVRSGRPPAHEPVVVLAVAALLPDLIDKPLSWGLGVFQSGYALGHSVFLALPASIAVLLWARRAGRLPLGTALVVGYWSHLAGDVVPIVLSGGGIAIGHLLWPVVVLEGASGEGVWLTTLGEFRPYLESVVAGDPSLSLLVHVGLVVATLGLWLADGCPGLAVLPGVGSRSGTRETK